MNRTELALRPARSGEHGLCAAVHVAARSRAVADGTMPPEPDADEPATQWMRRAVLPHRDVWLALDPSSGPPGAVALLVLDVAWLDQLYVVPAWWRRGVASSLLGLAKVLRPDGFGLWTFEVNLPARHLYERHGLVPVGRTDGSGNSARAADIAYAWRPGARHRADHETARQPSSARPVT